tara:strand:- start:92 stop:496 length:405 start_codon:yes stop_codon:yes gene_type:complete
MIKFKRLKNLIILKDKNLNIQRNEVITLAKELEKIKSLNLRLKNILANIENEPPSNARDLRDINYFNIKIIDQIKVADNREKFLEIELRRSRENLGKLMQQKKVIKDKIEYSLKVEIDKIEKKFLEDTPNRRKT